MGRRKKLNLGGKQKLWCRNNQGKGGGRGRGKGRVGERPKPKPFLGLGFSTAKHLPLEEKLLAMMLMLP